MWSNYHRLGSFSGIWNGWTDDRADDCQTPGTWLETPRRLVHFGAEVVWAARHEWARTIEDVLGRRNRTLFLNARAALEIAPSVARWMAEEQGRDTSCQASQIRAFEEVARNF